MKAQFKMALAVATIAAVLPALALADCSIDGVITAAPNPDPMGPAWVYTAVIDWNTGSQYALSHMDLWLDVVGGTCGCQDFQNAISWGDPIGQSGVACSVSYYGELNCQGDPSIPGVQGIALKLEPMEGGGCEAGTAGQGTFTFYSNLAPAAIDEDAVTLVDKYARQYCFGNLSGVFPALPCDPVAAQETNWGSVKGMFR